MTQLSSPAHMHQNLQNKCQWLVRKSQRCSLSLKCCLSNILADIEIDTVWKSMDFDNLVLKNNSEELDTERKEVLGPLRPTYFTS